MPGEVVQAQRVELDRSLLDIDAILLRAARPGSSMVT